MLDTIVKFSALSLGQKDKMRQNAVRYCGAHFNKRNLIDRVEEEMNLNQKMNSYRLCIEQSEFDG